MTEKSENILIGYTKWLLKWAAILCVIAGIGIGSWFGYIQYQDQVVPMVAIKCGSSTSEEESLRPRYYLIQKRRDESVPHALYRPAFYNKNITKDMTADQYWRQYFYQENKDWFDEGAKKNYSASRFAPFSHSGDDLKTEHWVVRETLQVIWWTREKNDKEWKSHMQKDCEEISTDEFHAESVRGLEEEQAKLKF